MAGRFGTLVLRAHELASYRAAVIATAAEEDRDACERLLGQLASLENRYADSDAELSFSPPPGARDLAERALAELRAGTLRHRTPRPVA